MPKIYFKYAFITTLLFAANVGLAEIPNEILISNQLFHVSQFFHTCFPDKAQSERKNVNEKRIFHVNNKKAWLTINNHGVNSAHLYINGNKIILDPILKQSKVTLDVSSYVHDGSNTLHIDEINPKENAYLEIFTPYPTLDISDAISSTFSKPLLDKVDQAIQYDINQGLPGAVLLIIKDGKIVKWNAYGYKNIYSPLGEKLSESFYEPMELTTLFDVASLTKIYATTFALMKLYYEKKLDIKAPLKQYIAAYPYEHVTIQDLSHHCAGYPPVVPTYQSKVNGKDNPLYSLNKNNTLKLFESSYLINNKTSKMHVYSDIDYVLLGSLIEHIQNQPLDQYLASEIYQPLQLKHTMFNPLKKEGISIKNIAATAILGNTPTDSDYPHRRQALIRGEAHDEIAYYSMDGISGHAGLFSNAYDLAVMMQVILNGGGYGDCKLFDSNTIATFTNPSEIDDTYAMGWRRAGTHQNFKNVFGPYASHAAIGHTGFTGVVTLIESVSIGCCFTYDKIANALD